MIRTLKGCSVAILNVEETPVEVTKTVLCLDTVPTYLFLRYTPPTGMRLIVFPEIGWVDRKEGEQLGDRLIHERITIRYDQPLDPAGNGETIYNPSPDLLLTLATCEFDVAIIGNNMGAGLKKAACFSKDKADRVIAVAHKLSSLSEYESLGITRATMRFNQYYLSLYLDEILTR